LTLSPVLICITFPIKAAKLINFAPLKQMNMEYLSISEYDYDLPEEKIARYPLERRDLSKLLIYKNNTISNDLFSNLHSHLPSDSLMVFNDTRVIQARLIFKKETGAEIEIFCLEPLDPADYYQSFQKTGSVVWKCLVGNLKKWKEGEVFLEFFIQDVKVIVEACREKDYNDWQQIKFSWKHEPINFGDILEYAGKTPIPPYLRRESEESDKSRYQTIYSVVSGSVAAPTAGLHFTPQVFEKLENKGIEYSYLTLHVGAGTFRPVKEDNAMLHPMHSEHLYIKKDFLEQLIRFERKITAVGTTSLRALESIYWIGAKIIMNIENPTFISQWEVYQLNINYQFNEAVHALINYCTINKLEQFEAITQLMIVPGYTIRTANRLITNFHQPKSTLLMLVAAFAGKENWNNIYRYALENNFRFLSYGDSSLISMLENQKENMPQKHKSTKVH
jgi:S-adenosylmethionine:tRNA ribosyltransferase-isomerase